MRAKQFCAFTTTESRAKNWRQQNEFTPPVAEAAVRSKAVVLLSLIHYPPTSFVCGGFTVFMLSVRASIRVSVHNVLFP